MYKSMDHPETLKIMKDITKKDFISQQERLNSFKLAPGHYTIRESYEGFSPKKVNFPQFKAPRTTITEEIAKRRKEEPGTGFYEPK